MSSLDYKKKKRHKVQPRTLQFCSYTVMEVMQMIYLHLQITSQNNTPLFHWKRHLLTHTEEKHGIQLILMLTKTNGPIWRRPKIIGQISTSMGLFF